ncbi:MAG TPA: hypothetical protein VIM14_14735, partial [Polyangia bacterium]
AWAAVRDANIRPFVEWIVPSPVSLPVLPAVRNNGGGPPHQGGSRPQGQQQAGQQNGDGNRKRKRRRRRGHDRSEQPAAPNRGPRLPGVYNPGGD